MLNKEKIASITSNLLVDNELFLVDISLSAQNDIEIIIDSDSRVGIDQCATLSRAIENELEATGEDDFSLTVASAGIGNPLTVDRQFIKTIGKTVDIVLANGQKLEAELIAYDPETITISYQQKVAVEGKKRKELVVNQQKINHNEIKSVREALSIK